MELIEVKSGFWMIEHRGWWHLHYGIPEVVSVRAESESDALAQMTTRLRQMWVDSIGRVALQDLYMRAITWVESYRQ